MEVGKKGAIKLCLNTFVPHLLLILTKMTPWRLVKDAEVTRKK